MTEDGALRTDNLALATMLAMAGHEYKLVKITQKKCIWIFVPPPEKEEAFDDLVNDWENFDCKVEPRTFMLRFGEMRDELFAHAPAPRRPGAPAPAQA